jgi:hypothetical protein
MKLYTMILDRSVSMSSIWDSITKAVNDHIESKGKEAGVFSSLLLFDTAGLDFLFKYSLTPERLNNENFKPRGATPLRDAIMYGIETLSRDWQDFLRSDGVEVEFTIFTDGAENSSKFWKSEDVARAITHFQEQYGWKFSFIGSGNHSDVANYAKQFGIKSENVVGYTSEKELTEAFAQV